MARIYSSYEEHELESVKKKAEELGFNLSSFQKYAVMLYLGEKTNTIPVADLREEMISELQKWEVGKPFVVSALLPEKWPGFDRSTKMQLAMFLKAYVNEHQNQYIIAGKANETINIYQKIK